MPLTFVTKDTMPTDPEGNTYAGHEVALAFSPDLKFCGGEATSNGVYPNAAANIGGADAYHIHAIAMAGVIWRVCVTFLSNDKHVGFAFFWPTPQAARTFNVYCTQLPKNNEDARTFAEARFEAFYNAAGKTPAAAANALIVAEINKRVKAQADLEAFEAKQKAEAEKKPIVVSTSVRDQGLFGQTANANVMTDEEAQAKIDKYVKDSNVKLLAGDNRAMLVALKAGKKKDAWPNFIKPYYDGIFPG